MAREINQQTKNKTQGTHLILKIYNTKQVIFSFELDITKQILWLSSLAPGWNSNK